MTTAPTPSRRKFSYGAAFLTLLTIACAVIWFFPIYWAMVTSLRTDDEAVSAGFALWPANPTLGSFIYIIENSNIMRWYLNSTITSVLTTVITVFMAACCGYAISQLKFPGRTALWWVILASFMVPAQALIVNHYVIMARIDLLNTYAGVILPMLLNPVTVIVYKQFFDGLPREYREAALMDGATEFQLLFRVFIPMNWGVTAALAIISFIGAWNSFLWAVSGRQHRGNDECDRRHFAGAGCLRRRLCPCSGRGGHGGSAGGACLSSVSAPRHAGHHPVRRHQRLVQGSTMSSVQLQNISKSYGAVSVIDGLDLSVEDGSFCALLGPSGCGKSTLLRMIAGLEEVSGGTITIDARDITHEAPAHRKVAMVFQNYALYPHLTVRQNVAFSLSLAGAPKAEQTEKADRVAKMLQLEPLMDRRPAQLSGGQRQRVAIGRALVRDPQVFLFDEPLSNLDALLRVQMRLELAKLHNDLKTTMIYVTHDQVEAMTLADKIVVLDKGKISQVGRPWDLYNAPANRFVAGFIGSPAMNFLPAVAANDGAGLKVTVGDATLTLPARAGRAGNQTVELGIRPEDITLTNPGAGHLDGRSTVVEYLGNTTYAYIDTTFGTITVETPSAEGLSPGTAVGLTLDATKAHVFDSSGKAWARAE